MNWHLMLSSATMLVVAPSFETAVAASETAQAAAPATIAAGTWAGELADTGWTLQLRHEAGNWTGQYMSARSNKWQPLHALVVAGRRVTFNIKSQPQLDFALEIDRSNRAMSGTASIGRSITLPFSAVRRS